MISGGKRKTQNGEAGMATLEALPLLIVFIVLFAYALGSFGVVHSGILNSIAARTYAFEIFRHRTNLTYLRSNSPNSMYYTKHGHRIHTVVSENGSGGDNFPATERRVAMGLDTSMVGRDNPNVHNVAIYTIQDGAQNQTIEANPVWIMTQYGICLDTSCGD